MSHTITTHTRVVTSSSGGSSALLINTGYLKTLPGLLKLAQLIIGGFCVFFLSYNFWSVYVRGTELFFLMMATSFFIGTFCLLVSCLFSFSTGGIISKTMYELIYHSVAFILLLVASILLLIKATDYYRSSTHPFMMAAVLGLVNSLLYLISAFLAQRSYRGI